MPLIDAPVQPQLMGFSGPGFNPDPAKAHSVPEFNEPNANRWPLEEHLFVFEPQQTQVGRSAVGSVTFGHLTIGGRRAMLTRVDRS